MRRELKKRNVKHLKVVYSKEKPVRPIEDMGISCRTNCICPPGAAHKCTERRDIPGSTAFVPSVVGLIIASEVIKDITHDAMVKTRHEERKSIFANAFNTRRLKSSPRQRTRILLRKTRRISMSKVINSALELIGNTPLLNASRYAKNAGIEGVTLLTKLEYLNPAGSVKDRVALAMIEDAEKKGELKPGAMIIEPTSGNTGIGLAAVAVAKGYRAVLTLPDTMSVERRNLLKAYGAEIVLTEGAKGMKGAIAKAEELKEQNPGSVILGQFVNPANPAVHKATTGPEIWEQTEGKVDIFVAGVGTGGTVTGVGEYLKSQHPDVKVVAVEPATSPVLSKGEAGPHKIQGIGAGFVPETLNTKIYDEVIAIENEDAFVEGRSFAKSEGILVGISSGAALKAAQILAARPENAGKTIVALLPDSGDRYLSTALFNEQ